MEQPLVTVIVVSYNHSQYIRENLDSIKNQTYGNIQLIVGDDAS
jgi:glycosyltransferase involved in cell wall biosynthesis